MTETDVERMLETESDADAAGDELSSLEHRHYEAIRAMNFKCLDASGNYEASKAETSSLKKIYESLQNQLNSLIAQGPNPQRELEFPGDESPADAWRDVPITDAIEMTDKQFEKLEAAGVRTVGQFEDLRSGQVDGYPDGLRSVKGVGQKTVDAWEEQIVNWLMIHLRDTSEDGADDNAGIEPEKE